jgi:hypothetical protein
VNGTGHAGISESTNATEQTISDLEAKLVETRKSLDEANQNLHHEEERTVAAVEKLDMAELELDKIKKELEMRDSILTKAFGRLHDLETTPDQDTPSYQSNSAVERLEMDLEAEKLKSERLQRECDKLKDNLKRAMRQLDDTKEAFEEHLKTCEGDGTQTPTIADPETQKESEADLYRDTEVIAQLHEQLAEAKTRLEQSVPKTEFDNMQMERDQAIQQVERADTWATAMDAEVQKQRGLAEKHLQEDTERAKEMETLKSAKADLATKLKAAEVALQASNERVLELEKLTGEYDVEEKRLGDLQAEYKNLETDLKDAKAALKNLQTRFDEDMAKRDQERETLVAENEELRMKCRAADNAMTNLQECEQGRRQQSEVIEDLQDKLEEKDEGLTKTERDLKVSESIRKMQEQDIKILEGQLKEVRKQADEELEEVKQQLEEPQELTNTANETMTETSEENATLEEQVEKLKAELEAAELKNNELERLNSEAIPQTSDHESQLKEAKTALQDKLNREHEQIMQDAKKQWEAEAETNCSRRMEEERMKWETEAEKKTTKEMEQMLDEEKAVNEKKFEEERMKWDSKCKEKTEALLADQKLKIEKEAKAEAAEKLEVEKKEWVEHAQEQATKIMDKLRNDEKKLEEERMELERKKKEEEALLARRKAEIEEQAQLVSKQLEAAKKLEDAEKKRDDKTEEKNEQLAQQKAEDAKNLEDKDHESEGPRRGEKTDNDGKASDAQIPPQELKQPTAEAKSEQDGISAVGKSPKLRPTEEQSTDQGSQGPDAVIESPNPKDAEIQTGDDNATDPTSASGPKPTPNEDQQPKAKPQACKACGEVYDKPKFQHMLGDCKRAKERKASTAAQRRKSTPAVQQATPSQPGQVSKAGLSRSVYAPLPQSQPLSPSVWLNGRPPEESGAGVGQPQSPAGAGTQDRGGKLRAEAEEFVSVGAREKGKGKRD